MIQIAELLLEIETVTFMDLERAAAVGRAFDADPELRPRRVGGDPARIKVEGSLEELIRQAGLPIQWLTVRTNSRLEGFEGGEIVLRPGRGGYTSRWDPKDTFILVPNEVTAGFLRSWADGEPGRLDRIAALFVRLCEAMDANWGMTSLLPRKRRIPPVDVGLGDVGWLNYFGPAFVERFPTLSELAGDVTRLSNGGVAIRIAAEPWDLDDSTKQPVIHAIGQEAFVKVWGVAGKEGIHVPSYEDHMAFSPGPMEMPWVSGERERAAAKAERSRERRYAAARRRRLAAQGEGGESSPSREAEWSTSFDADDWRSFGRRLFRRLGGELSAPLGKALLEEIASAPLQTEESLTVATDVGSVEVHWFIDDVDTVDIALFGPARISAMIDAVYARWSEA